MLVIGVSHNDPHTDTKCEHIDGMQNKYCLLYVTFGNQKHQALPEPETEVAVTEPTVEVSKENEW